MQFCLRPAQFRAAGACAFAIATLFAVTPVAAQGAASSANPPAVGAAPTILWPAMLTPGTADLACSRGAAGLAPWGIDRIQKSLSLTDEQAAKFNELKTASQKAVKYLKETCPTNDPVTPTGRVDATEHRLEAMLEAARTVKPALHDFYGSLSDEQKARLTALEETNTGADAGARSADNAGAGDAGSPHRYSHHAHFHGRRHWVFRLPFPF